jgi:hypothetical protein
MLIDGLCDQTRQSATIVGNQRDMTFFSLLAIPLTTEQVPFPGSTS